MKIIFTCNFATRLNLIKIERLSDWSKMLLLAFVEIKRKVA